HIPAHPGRSRMSSLTSMSRTLGTRQGRHGKSCNLEPAGLSQNSNPGAGDDFGEPVNVSEDTLVVGAEGEDSTATGVNGIQSNNSASYSGAVYVFIRSGTNWSQQAYLKASNTGANDAFGLAA